MYVIDRDIGAETLVLPLWFGSNMLTVQLYPWDKHDSTLRGVRVYLFPL